MNKKGQRGESITLGGSFALIVFGVIFLSASGSDTTGILNMMGIIFIAGGIIGFIALLVKFFSHSR